MRSHHHTDAIVLKSFPHGEASLTMVFFTRELGLIYARAQGVRKVHAKLRAHIPDYSLTAISLVRGREVWRLINARRIFPHFQATDNARLLRARLTLLLERFVVGGGEHEALFAEYETIWQLLENEQLSREEQEYLEVVAVLRIMHLLGYVGEGASFGPLLREAVLSKEMLERVPAIKADAVAAINASFSHKNTPRFYEMLEKVASFH